ncbi:mitogen-activated protein kinase [Saccharomycopsis crataegensis]|uniref:Mitogen-activated protein kinase n=1 Tax=Saccharomycopsis crataegensis TaxID=43959 RepID=A0AAV5QKK4_9ASCO|nr:mitogen-activated protein kinase [Saccharomycopsis crataegensis]
MVVYNENHETPFSKKGHVIYEKANFFIDSRYEIQRILGKGSYGTVCSAIDKKVKDSTRPSEIAIKKVSNIFTKEVLLKRAVRELRLMRHFKGHKNIVSLIDIDIVYIKPFDGLYCFQELIEYDLARVIQSSVQFSEFHIKSFLYQLLCGLKYIHSAEVIHRDLKPGNVLCTMQGILKICDFGLARGICPSYLRKSTSIITNYVATRWYRAPELILSKRSYSKPVDMWAIGCIFAELYGRRPLFIGNDQLNQITEIIKVLGTPPEEAISKYGSRMAWEFFSPPKPQYQAIPWCDIYAHISNEAADLLEHLICWDISRRYSVEKALDHSFLKSIRDTNNEPSCKQPFDFSFENTETTLPDLKVILQKEVESFRVERSGNKIHS